jgi:hypothetical protein
MRNAIRARTTRPPDRPARSSRSTWGGARDGAGKRSRAAIASEPHTRRPPLARGESVHIVARVARDVSLSPTPARAALARAVALSDRRSDFRIVRLAIAGRARRVELVVVADDRFALARGMQGFQVAAARGLNRAAARSGTVFPDRYRFAVNGVTRPSVPAGPRARRR